MGKGRKRNTAKTGDKGLYKNRLHHAKNSRTDGNDTADDNPMYSRIDRFHEHRERNQDLLRFEQASDRDEDEEDEQMEAVMNLAYDDGKISDSDQDVDTNSDDHSDNDSFDDTKADDDSAEASSGEGASLSSFDDHEDLVQMEDVRDWGSKKSTYYHGDTGDLEIGQDKQDAYLEEEAAKEVQAARLRDMSEDDFILSDVEDTLNNKTNIQNAHGDVVIRDLSSKLTSKAKNRIIEKDHPELIPLMVHFREVIKDYVESTSVATEVIFDCDETNAESVGMTKSGKRYLVTKALLQTSSALNLVLYLLLKADHAENEDIDSSLIQSHPVIARLRKLDSLAQKLNESVETKADGLLDQLETLVKAAAMMKSDRMSVTDDEQHAVQECLQNGQKRRPGNSNSIDALNDDIQASTDAKRFEKEDEVFMDKEKDSLNLLNEARFGLRASEIERLPGSRPFERRLLGTDFGDEESYVGVDTAKVASRIVASNLNSIKQRAASRSRKSIQFADEVDEHEESNNEVRHSLEMMETELGRTVDNEENLDDIDEHGASSMHGEDDDQERSFYSKITENSKVKKESKRQRYTVAPKFPRMDREIEGERAITKAILKNRGLVAHKAKINRNPRVKKREQYRKALVRRKGAVREVRTNEVHKYSGEETGVKKGISRSRKLV